MGSLVTPVACRCQRHGARPGPASRNPTGFGSSGGLGGVTELADRALAGLAQGGSQDLDALIQLGVLDQDRRQEPDHRASAG